MSTVFFRTTTGSQLFSVPDSKCWFVSSEYLYGLGMENLKDYFFHHESSWTLRPSGKALLCVPPPLEVRLINTRGIEPSLLWQCYYEPPSLPERPRITTRLTTSVVSLPSQTPTPSMFISMGLIQWFVHHEYDCSGCMLNSKYD